MSFGKGPSAPAPPPPPPPPPNPGIPADAARAAGVLERRQAAVAGGAGFDNTVTNTGGDTGVASAPVERKQLLGQ